MRIIYWKDTWRFPGSNEYEYKYAGKYGAKGERRAKRKKATPDQIKKQNQFNKEKRMRRLIKANFEEGDHWTTLKYTEGTRKLPDEVKNDMQKFLRDMRREYKKLGGEFKFIYRMEVGARGGIHIHLLANRMEGRDTDKLIQKRWKHGRASFEGIYEAGGFEKLANYIVKQPEEGSKEYKQLSLFEKEDQKELIKYSSSRNLIRPEPERREYRMWTMRKLILEGPKPTPGYYIDKDSIRYGINRFTGMSYYSYTEVRIRGSDHEKG